MITETKSKIPITKSVQFLDSNQRVGDRAENDECECKQVKVWLFSRCYAKLNAKCRNEEREEEWERETNRDKGKSTENQLIRMRKAREREEEIRIDTRGW